MKYYKALIEIPTNLTCKEYKFLVLNNIYETAELVNINAKSNQEAWRILNTDSRLNYENGFLLTPRLKNQLKKVLKYL